MNNARRKQLREIVARLEELEVFRIRIKEQLESVFEDEEEALNNMPESLYWGERGQQMQSKLNDLEEALEYLFDLDVDSIRFKIEDVIG